MREIKFRGHNGSEWIYGDIVSYKSSALEFTEYWMADCNSDKDNDDIQNWDSVSYVGQYTGLKDINGVEIYEGDIVEFIHSGEKHRSEIYYKELEGFWFKFTYEDYKYHFSISDLKIHHRKTKVIGNIYEDPELLEEAYEN